MLLKRNRYRSANLVNQLNNQLPQKDGDEWCFKFECYKFDSELDDFEAYLSDSINEHERCRFLLSDFLKHIHSLDNLVQEFCEQEQKDSGMDISNYKLHIGYIDIKENTIVVCYYGTVVNTEWDAEFQKDENDKWIKINF